MGYFCNEKDLPNISPYLHHETCSKKLARQKQNIYYGKINISIGLISAKGIKPTSNNNVKKNNSKSITDKKKKKEQCKVVYATCTSAVTCQNWTAEQWYDWALAIQQNYCQLGGEYAY